MEAYIFVKGEQSGDYLVMNCGESSGADIAAAEQFIDSYRYLSGEKALMLGVLEDAIRCFQNRNPCHKPRLLSTQAEEWMRADDWDWPFSFNNVSDALGLEPAALRTTLLRCKAQPLAILKRRTLVAPRKVYRLHLRNVVRTGGVH